MPSEIPTVQFNNGEVYPIFGLGTWHSKPGEVTQAVKDAIDIGYRHIDCAHSYFNEHEIGEAIKAKIAEGVVKREDLYITSKLSSLYHTPSKVEPALRVTLADLGLDYVDLYLMHWPFALKVESDTSHHGKYGSTDIDYLDTWKAMEDLVRKGLVKSLGVSNFNKKQLERLIENATIMPVINQIECHPYLTQVELSDFCESKNIRVAAFCPLGSPDRVGVKPEDAIILEDPQIVKMAKKYHKTPAQVLIKYQIQRGHMVIPKSIHKQRLAENLDILDFELAPKDIDLITSFDRNGRTVVMKEFNDSKDYPFNNDML